MQVICCDETIGMINKTATQTAMFYHYVDDVDAKYTKALAKGCTKHVNTYATAGGPSNAFWGDRTAAVQDPYGHVWILAKKHGLKDTEDVKEHEEAWMGEYKKVE